MCRFCVCVNVCVCEREGEGGGGGCHLLCVFVCSGSIDCIVVCCSSFSCGNLVLFHSGWLVHSHIHNVRSFHLVWKGPSKSNNSGSSGIADETIVGEAIHHHPITTVVKYKVCLPNEVVVEDVTAVVVVVVAVTTTATTTTMVGATVVLGPTNPMVVVVVEIVGMFRNAEIVADIPATGIMTIGNDPGDTDKLTNKQFK